MAAFDHAIKMIADASGLQLARMAGINCQRLQPVESTLPRTTEMLADRAFRARRRREQFVLYFEFYTHWDRDAPWDMLAKSGFLSRREHLATACLAFVLLRRGFRSPGGQLRLEALARPTQQLWFREIPLWEQDPQPWWEEVPGLMALYPLCRHLRRPREAITHATAVIEANTAEGPERAELLACLSMFGRLAFPRLDVKTIIGREKMKESPFIREMQDEARAEERRAAILKILKRRFGEQADRALAAQLDECTDLRRLDRLFDKALDCASIEEFRRALP
jgi:hypothetical protein